MITRKISSVLGSAANATQLVRKLSSAPVTGKSPIKIRDGNATLTIQATSFTARARKDSNKK